jgi:hypothetical protein
MRRNAALLLSALVLVACSSEQQEAADEARTLGVMATAPAASASAESTARDAPPPPPPPPQGAGALPATAAPARASTTPLLAYEYAYSIVAPVAQVVPLARRHEQACLAAGPLVCQVVGAQNAAAGKDRVTAELTFRATPAYVQRFRDGLQREVDGARGDIRDSRVSTEDLTRGIVDTEAGLRARQLLQGRLEQLIASRPGNLQQLLELERELARVRGEIDAMQSNLEVMRARVRMSKVTLHYASRGSVLSDQSFNPLGRAGRDFLNNMAQSLAVMIDALSILAPWLVAAGLGIWGVTSWRRRRRVAAPAAPDHPAAEPPA